MHYNLDLDHYSYMVAGLMWAGIVLALAIAIFARD